MKSVSLVVCLFYKLAQSILKLKNGTAAFKNFIEFGAQNY
jgi:hypothetical protein